MQKIAFGSGLRMPAKFLCGSWPGPFNQTLRIMRMTVLLLIAGFMSVHAAVFSQAVSLSGKDMPLKKVFSTIKKQTGFSVFTTSQVLENTSLVTVSVKNMPLQTFLELALKDQPVNFRINGKTIVLSRKAMPAAPEAALPPPVRVSGVILDASEQPLVGVSIRVKGTTRGTTTSATGFFSLDDLAENTVLQISMVGYNTTEITIKKTGEGYTAVAAGNTGLTVKPGADVVIDLVMKPGISPLDEVKVIAYGTTTERRNVGAVTTIKSETIERQPVADVLQSLSSNVPGLVINQVSGLTGSGYANIQIRGVNSIGSGSAPLFLVDGVQVTGEDRFVFGTNPFITIGPENIESVSVLKDADATAIYGSRGANGVILITTKKGKAGATRVNAKLSGGFSRYTKAAKTVSTAQYLEMRREAFANDGETPDELTAPDLFGYGVGSDVDRYTDWQHELMGYGASLSDAQFSVSGGSNNTTFSFGAGYHRETPPLPGNSFFFERPTLHMSLSHTSADNRFKITVGTNYTITKSNFAQEDISYYLSSLPPNMPELKNDDGTFNYVNGLYNPYASFARPQRRNNKDLIANAMLSYQLAKGLVLKGTFGYTDVNRNSVSISPLVTFSPDWGMTSGSGNFINVRSNNWQLEPQLEYTRNIGNGRLTALLGATYQQMINSDESINATDYSSESTLDNFATAANISATPYYSNYKYAATFARINYNLSDKYLLNLTARRDGSSRFGPGRQFGNFGAVGAGWVFSEESFVQEGLPWLSFGKLRVSAGVTGNDQIGDYKYLNSYGATTIASGIATFFGFSYDGISSLSPTALYNPAYGWESTRKYEAGLDVGVYKDRVLLNISYYNNRSSSQLLNYSLPPTTGFTGILRNLPAAIANNGWEFTLNTVNIESKKFTWSSALNMTIPRNKLVSFPGLETSTYANTYVLGQPLSVQKVFRYVGVDPQTGIYVFQDKDGKPTSQPVPGTDQTDFVNLDRRLYGGFTNTLRYGAVQLVVDLQFVKQMNYDPTVSYTPAGAMGNYVTDIMDRWQKPGDITNIQRFTQSTSSDAYLAGYYATMSSRAFTDGSYVRVKNVSLSVDLDKRFIERIHSKGIRIYANAQNLFTFTRYPGNDPETGGMGSMPPMRTIVAGLQCSF